MRYEISDIVAGSVFGELVGRTRNDAGHFVQNVFEENLRGEAVDEVDVDVMKGQALKKSLDNGCFAWIKKSNVSFWLLIVGCCYCGLLVVGRLFDWLVVR